MSTVSNTCTKLLFRNPDGTEVRVPKKKFDNLESAISAAKEINMNKNNKQIHKVKAYKCSVCHKYHIGRGKKLLDVINRKSKDDRNDHPQ